MNRNQLLATSTAVLIAFAIAYHIWANWGLITIHAQKEPLGKVIASMERQGHATIKTDIPSETPVTMDCEKVQLADALETLSVCTDSRWRLLFFAAGDKSTLKSGEDAWLTGNKPDGWTMVSFPMGNMIAQLTGDDDIPPTDPRKDSWTPQLAGPAQVQAYFAEAAQVTNAGFAFPDAWNPSVKSAPSAGTVDKMIPKLISNAGGREDAVFFLSLNRGGGQRNAGGGGPTMGGFNPELIAARMQTEINRLPPDSRAEAQAAYDSEAQFRKSLDGLTDDEKRAAFMQHMQDPNVQQMMQNRMDSREGRMNHAQRQQRMQQMVQRKLTAMGKL